MQYDIRTLAAIDWAAFEADWRAQAIEADEIFEDDAASSFAVLEGVCSGRIPQVSNINKSGVAAVQSKLDGRFYAACMWNHAHLPGDSGPTMRVRHLIVSPLIDYGVVDEEVYADVLINALLGIVQLTESDYPAKTIKFHLRSPEDYSFFSVLRTTLAGAKTFASVRMAGAWLHITKA